MEHQTLETFIGNRSVGIQDLFVDDADSVLQTKDKKNPDSYEQQVHKPGSVMVWGCISSLDKGQLHFCVGSMALQQVYQ